VSWCSQKQKTVTLSATDAEYVAASEASKEAIWIRGFVNDLHIPGMHYDAIPLVIDNDAAQKLSRNPEFRNRAKYIDVRYHVLPEWVMEVKDLETIPCRHEGQCSRHLHQAIATGTNFRNSAVEWN
jgi:hypothetical protein